MWGRQKPWCHLLLKDDIRVTGISLRSVDIGSHRQPTHGTCQNWFHPLSWAPAIAKADPEGGKIFTEAAKETAFHMPLWQGSQERTVTYIVWIIPWRSLWIHWEQKARETRETWVLGLELTSENIPARMPQPSKQDKPSTISQWTVVKLACVTTAFPFRDGVTTVSSKILLSMAWRSSLGALPNPDWAHYVFSWAVCFMGGHFIVHREECMRRETRWEELFSFRKT